MIWFWFYLFIFLNCCCFFWNLSGRIIKILRMEGFAGHVCEIFRCHVLVSIWGLLGGGGTNYVHNLNNLSPIRVFWFGSLFWFCSLFLFFFFLFLFRINWFRIFRRGLADYVMKSFISLQTLFMEIFNSLLMFLGW